jgi:hypothetical protein
MPKEIVDYVRDHPPACLGYFQLASINPDSDEVAAFSLLGPASQTVGAVPGYELGRLLWGAHSPREFVGPLYVRWKGTTDRYLLLDTAVHGYHGIVDGGGGFATVRGKDRPETYGYRRCGGHYLKLEARFYYWGAAADLSEDEPELAIQNFFNAFTLQGTCDACGDVCTISQFDKV